MIENQQLKTFSQPVWIFRWLGLCLFIFCVTVLSADGHGGQAAFALLLTAIGLWVSGFHRKAPVPLESIEKIFLGLIITFWLIQVLGVIFQPAGYEYASLRERLKAADYPMRWVLLLPVYFLFRRYLMDWRVIPVGLSIGACFSVGIAHYQVYFLGFDRAIGASNHPIPFAQLMVVVDLLLWGYMTYAWDLGKKWLAAFFLVASLIAFYGSLLAVTRGAWLAYVVMVLIWVFYTLFKGARNIRNFISLPNVLRILLAGTLFLFVSTTHQYEVMKARSLDAIAHIEAGNFDQASSRRVLFFKASIESITEHPFGIGTDNFSRLNVLTDKSHAHNELLNIFVENGVQGGVVLLLLAFAVIWFLFTRIRRGNELSRLYAMSGLMLVIGYAIFGTTQAVFSHNDTLMFFIFLLYCILGQIIFMSSSENMNCK